MRKTLAFIAGLLILASYPARAETLAQVQEVARPCVDDPQGPLCKQALPGALRILSVYLRGEAPHAEAAILNQRAAVIETCRHTKQLLLRRDGDVAVVWEYLLERKDAWTPLIREKVLHAAKAQAKYKTGRVHTDQEALVYVTNHIAGSGRRMGCGFGTRLLGDLLAGDVVRQAQTEGPPVVAEIATLIRTDVENDDAAAKEAGVALLAIFSDVQPHAPTRHRRR